MDLYCEIKKCKICKKWIDKTNQLVLVGLDGYHNYCLYIKNNKTKVKDLIYNA